MNTTPRVMRSWVCAVLALFMLLPSIAEAAYPRLLMIHGRPLTKPVVIENPFDVVKIFDGQSQAMNSIVLQGRPYLELTLFWGDTWNRYMDEGKSASALRPENVTAFGNIPIHGRFYPVCLDAPAVMTLTEVDGSTVRNVIRISDAGMRVLEALAEIRSAGIPMVRVICASPTGSELPARVTVP